MVHRGTPARDSLSPRRTWEAWPNARTYICPRWRGRHPLARKPREKTITTFHIFNTVRRKWLKLVWFDRFVVESRCCGRRFESGGPTVTNMKQPTTGHHSAPDRAMSSTKPKTWVGKRSTGQLSPTSDHRPRSLSCTCWPTRPTKTFPATPRSTHSWPNPVLGEAPSCERCRNWKLQASSHAARSSTIPEHSDPPATTSTTPKHPI